MPPRQPKLSVFIRLIDARANAFRRSRELSGLIDEEKKSLALASNEPAESEESKNGDTKRSGKSSKVIEQDEPNKVEDLELVKEKIKLLEEECRASESEMANIQNSIDNVAHELASLAYIVISDEEHVVAIDNLMFEYGFHGYALISPGLNDQDREKVEFRLQVENVPYRGGVED